MLVGSVLLAAVNAQAATLTLAPDALVSSTGWAANSGTTLSAVLTNDADSTYVSTGGTNPLRVGVADPAQAGTITSVTLRVVARSIKSMGGGSTTVGLTYGLALGSGTPATTTGSVTENGGVYQTLTQQLTSRPGGGSWTWTDVANLQAVVQATSFAMNTTLRVTQIEVVVEYTASTPNTVTFSAHTAGSPTASSVSPSQEVVVGRFSLARTAGNTSGPVVETVTVNDSKASPATNISGVYVYRDVNDDGALDGGDVKLNASAATFSGANAVVSVGEPVSDSPEQYLITYVVASGAADGATMDAKVTAASTTNIQTVSGLPLPATPPVFTVERPTLTVTNSDHVPAEFTYVRSLAADVLVDNLKLAASDGDVSVNSVTVHRPPTVAAGSIAAVKLYLDDGDGIFEPAQDGLLGSGTYGAEGNAVFSALGIDISSGGSADVWIAYDVAELCAHAERLGSQVVNGAILVDAPATVASFGTLTSPLSGEHIVVDNVAPDPVASVITQPADGTVISLAPGVEYQITGTALDALSGVAWVKVSVKRLTDPAAWWDFDSSTWVAIETWANATDTGGGDYSTWDPAFEVPEADGESLEVSALFGDQAGNEFLTVVSLLVDNVKPTVQSVIAIDANTVDVIFSEALDQISAPDSADFTVSDGIAVSDAAWQDARTIRLTTDTQVADTIYTLTVAAGAVADTTGNANDVQSMEFSAFGSTTDLVPPSVPTDVAAVAGANPVIASVSWDASTGGPVGYIVLRATNPAGPFVAIGDVSAASFNDTTGIPGQDYYYAVKAYDAAGNISAQSDTAGPVSANWIPSPHGSYTSASTLCASCHTPHVAVEEGPLFRQTGETAGELSVCYTCHDGALAGNIESGAENSFSEDLLSGHSVEQTYELTSDLTDVCSDCHSPHQDPDDRGSLPAQEVNGVEVAAAGNGWCLACHNATADWYEDGGYGTLLTDPSRNATGYPTAGTFPGYLDDANNPHAAIPASTEPTRVAGDCLYCHASHRAANEFDGLVSAFTSEDFTLCFDCHDGTTTGENIKQYYPADAGGSATQTADTRFGHRTETAGTLEAGSALPCYDCHNPHGSATPNGLVVFTETASGTTIAVGDDANELDLSDATGVREFCFTCHTTCGSSGSNTDPYGWNGSAYAIVEAGAEFEGIDRTVRNDVAKTGLKVPVVAGHYRDDAPSCLTCHGEMTADGDVNIHAPGSGVSNGGMECYLCHLSYSAMDDSTASYHHVMDAAVPDVAPGDTSTYPTSDNVLACVSCHTDHNYFNDDKGANLRTDISDNSGTGSNTDFSGSAPYGICVSCHDQAQTKSTEQKVGGSEQTPVIDGADYVGKAHDYVVSNATKVGYDDGSTFEPNCTKCHDDENDSGLFQTGTYKIGLHTSAEDRIAKALGAAGTPTEEHLCFACHSGSSGTDGYSVESMGSASQSVATLFGSGYANTSSPWVVHQHAVGSYSAKHEADETQTDIGANKHVECEDCHDPHVAGDGASGSTLHTLGTNAIAQSTSPIAGVSGISMTTWPSFSGTAGVYGTTTEATAEYQVCFKCHSGANANVTSWGGSGATAWTNVALEFNPANRSYHPVAAAVGNPLPASWMKAEWQDVGVQTMFCSDCHTASSDSAAATGPHGSSIPHVLRAYWPNDANGDPYTINGLNGLPPGSPTQTGLLCDECHEGIANQTVHQRANNHKTAPCYNCHIIVPHGGKLERLVGDNTGSMPSRYAYNGNKANMKVDSYDWVSGAAYTKQDCGSDDSACTAGHGSTISTDPTENW